MKQLYFLRHGLSEGNIQGVWSGTGDSPLSAEGIKQAQQAAKHAKALGIDYIVCSPLSRAVKTARIVAREIGYPAKDIHINNLFIERHWGELEGKKWDPDLDLDGISDIETKDIILERAKLALAFLNSLPADNILVVSHGSFGRALRQHITGHAYTDRRVPREAVIPNGEIIRWPQGTG